MFLHGLVCAWLLEADPGTGVGHDARPSLTLRPTAGGRPWRRQRSTVGDRLWHRRKA
jgi:hypothetical protein